MKTVLLIIVSFFLKSTNCLSQQQWKFHIAFEDGAGAKDTIWLIWDTTAHGTLPVDIALGEGAVQFDHSSFNVWVYNFNNDSTKTVAYPYTVYPHHATEVRAFNFQYPITVRWDTALFHATYLPVQQGIVNIAEIINDYFFSVNNDPLMSAYNMLLDDSAYAPTFTWFSQSQFPMSFYIAYDPNLSISANISNGVKDFTNSPNPFYESLAISFNDKVKSIIIYSEEGRIVFVKSFFEPATLTNYQLMLSNLSPGFYIISVINSLNKTYYEKIIKEN